MQSLEQIVADNASAAGITVAQNLSEAKRGQFIRPLRSTGEAEPSVADRKIQSFQEVPSMNAA